MPHVCQRSDCHHCYLNRNNVVALHIVWTVEENGTRLPTIRAHEYSEDVQPHLGPLSCMVYLLYKKLSSDNDGKIKYGQFAQTGDELHVSNLTKSLKKDEYIFSWVSYPKPASRGTTTQNPRPVSEMVARPTPDSDDSDDPTVTV